MINEEIPILKEKSSHDIVLHKLLHNRKRHSLIVESDMMKQLLNDMSKIAKSSSSIFIN